MKILALGDLHGKLPKNIKQIAKDIDLILCTGDLGKADLMRKMAFQNIEREKKGLDKIIYSSKQKKRAFMQAYNSTIKMLHQLSKISLVFLIYGNVESTNSETKDLSKEIKLKLPLLTNKLREIKNVKLIHKKVVNFHGIKIGGLNYFIETNWLNEFKPEDYKEQIKYSKVIDQKVKNKLREFGKLDILLCHQPPHNILDKVGKGAPKHWKGKHAGSKIILEYLTKKQPKYVICGHIHEYQGIKTLGKTKIIAHGPASEGKATLIDFDNNLKKIKNIEFIS